MADGIGQADIRGLEIDKLAKGYADEENIFKRYVNVTPTSAREIRWYQKTSGFLTGVTTSGITSSPIANVAEGALPTVTGPTVTRNTSYVRKYFVESELITYEDINDSDLDMLMMTVRDLTRAVENQVDKRIWNVITENLSPTNINTAAATGTGWDDTTNGNPVLDIMVGLQKIRAQGYNPNNNCVLMINSIEHKNLMNYVVSVKGSSFPAHASEQIGSPEVMRIQGVTVVVSENADTDYAAMWIPDRAATWKTFMGITATTMEDPGIGVKIRVWEEGECLLTDPKAVHLITDTVT